MILNFFSGSHALPPLGFPYRPKLNFNDVNPLPTASTCVISLTLPSKYADYVTFKKKLDLAFTMHGGFGLK